MDPNYLPLLEESLSPCDDGKYMESLRRKRAEAAGYLIKNVGHVVTGRRNGVVGTWQIGAGIAVRLTESSTGQSLLGRIGTGMRAYG